MITNKPKLRYGKEDHTITMKFEQPPTQEEFDYWAAKLTIAMTYANQRTGMAWKIVSWKAKAPDDIEVRTSEAPL